MKRDFLMVFSFLNSIVFLEFIDLSDECVEVHLRLGNDKSESVGCQPSWLNSVFGSWRTCKRCCFCNQTKQFIKCALVKLFTQSFEKLSWSLLLWEFLGFDFGREAIKGSASDQWCDFGVKSDGISLQRSKCAWRQTAKDRRIEERFDNYSV